MIVIDSPFPQFNDLDGKPLDVGMLYFGVANQNPETSPTTVYWDSALTQPAAQPVVTLNGYASRSGSPALLYAATDYSLLVRDRRGRQVCYSPTSDATGNSQLQIFRQDLANAVNPLKGAALIGRGAQVVKSIAELKALSKDSASTTAVVLGYYSQGDGGGGVYYYDSSDVVTADNGGTIIVANDGGRWKLDWNEEVSIDQFGAVNDGDGNGGGTDNYTAISNCLSWAVAQAKPVTISFGRGTYRCDQGLSLDCSVHNLRGHGTELDFKNQAAGASTSAVTMVAPSLRQGTISITAITNSCEGITFKGKQGAGYSSPPVDLRSGLTITGEDDKIVTGYEFKHCVWRNFSTAIRLSTIGSSQAIRFIACNIIWSSTGFLMPLQTGGAAGSGYSFERCFITGCVTGVDLENPQADVTFFGGNIEGCSNHYVYHLAGRLSLFGTHFETGTDAVAYVIRQPGGIAGYATVVSVLNMHGVYFIVKGTRTVPVMSFSKYCNNTITGGEINTQAATHTTPIIASSGTEGNGALTIQGTRLAKATADTVFGIDTDIKLTYQWGETAGLASTIYNGADTFTATLTPNSVTLNSGSRTYTMTGNRYMDRCFFEIKITGGGSISTTANTSFLSGLPFDPLTEGSAVCVTGSVGDLATALISPAGTGQIYLPAVTNNTADIVISGHYKISP